MNQPKPNRRKENLTFMGQVAVAVFVLSIIWWVGESYNGYLLSRAYQGHRREAILWCQQNIRESRQTECLRWFGMKP